MSYLNEMVARSIAQERQRDTLLELRHQQLATRRAATTHVPAPTQHRRWHQALVRLHITHPRPST